MKTCALILLFCPLIAFAQSDLFGFVVSEQGEPIPGATIRLDGTQKGTISNTEGRFSFRNLAEGTYILEISAVGFITNRLEVVQAANSEPIIIKLKSNIQELEMVVVNADTETTEKKLGGFNVDILSVENFQDINVDVNRIIGTMSGVKIRERGGLGSGFELSLNGLSGNQVRYFIDEVPMEFYGSALTLNNLPSNLIKSIEVYKGVMPVNLTSDALGGGINISTPDPTENLLDLTYSFGSFNTHRASAVIQRSTKSGVNFRLMSFFNHSDNDYLMNSVPKVDELGNVLGYQKARRFHDAYSSGSISGQIGIVNKKWADEFSIGSTYAGNTNEIQHTDVSINRVYGGLITKNKTALGNIKYRKKWNKLQWKNDLVVGQVRETTYDTVMHRFDWNGQSRPINSAEYFGDPSMLTLTDDFIWARSGMDYQLNPNHSLSLQYSINFFTREGEDQINPRTGAPFSPNFLNKSFIGTSYDLQTPDTKLKSSVFVKRYWYEAEIHTDEFVGSGTEIIKSSSSLSRFGYGLALSYFLAPTLLVKSSYELAYRLPESYEIMGNGVLILPNPDLKPESSRNLNVGLIYNQTLKNGSLKSEWTGFFRPTEDKVWPVAQGVLSSFQNIAQTRVVGIETSNTLSLNNKYQLTLSLTYQEHTDRRKFNEGLPNSNYRERLPNDPYFFGDIAGQYRVNLRESRLTFMWNTRYVHSFFLYAEGNGNQSGKRIIPTQLVNDFNVSWTLREGMYNISATISNLFNEEVYDNWSLQKPGRAFYLKLRYFINK